jgi:hypothetical protein
MKREWKGITKILLVSVLGVILHVICAQIVTAQERTTGFSSGISFGVARFSDGDLGTGFSGRVFVEYAPYIHEIALRLSGGYLRFEDDIKLGREPFSSKENVVFEDLYGTGGLIYRFSRGKMVPFLTVNLGVYHYRMEDVSPAPGPIIGGVQLSPFDTVEEKVGNDFGFNLGGGVEYFMGNRTSLSLEMLMHSIHGEVNDRIFDFTMMFLFLPKNRYEK